MLYFRNKIDAEQFAAKQEHYEYIDFGEEAEEGRRYAVRVLDFD